MKRATNSAMETILAAALSVTHFCVLGSYTSQLFRILPETLFPTVPPQT